MGLRKPPRRNGHQTWEINKIKNTSQKRPYGRFCLWSQGDLNPSIRVTITDSSPRGDPQLHTLIIHYNIKKQKTETHVSRISRIQI